MELHGERRAGADFGSVAPPQRCGPRAPSQPRLISRHKSGQLKVDRYKKPLLTGRLFGIISSRGMKIWGTSLKYILKVLSSAI